MARKELPQNYVADAGEAIEDFEDASAWSVLNGTVEPDEEHHLSGTRSLKFITDASGSAGASTNVDFRLDQDGQFQLSLYIPDDPAYMDRFELFLSSRSDYAKYFYAPFYDRLFKGWNTLTFGKDEFYSENGEEWTNALIRLRIRLYASEGNIATVSFDDLRNRVRRLPRIVVTFDDSYASSYRDGILYMDDKGMKGTMYVISDLIGQTDYMSLSDCRDAYARGWALGNHTLDHLDLSTLTPSQIREQLQGCTQWLDANGFDRASRHAAYPFGGYNDEVLAAMSELGMKTGRTVLDGFHCAVPPLSAYELTTLNVTPDTSLETLKERVDWALAGNGPVNILFHDLVNGTPESEIQYPVSGFQAFVDYLEARHAPTATIDEWYEGLTNPRYRSLPLIRPTA